MPYISGKHPCRIDRDKRVVSVDLHTEGCSRIGHLRTDRSQSDDAQFLSLDLASGKCLLGLFHGFSDIFVFFIILYPVDPTYHVTGGQHQSGNYQFLYAVGIGPWCVKYHDSFVCTRIQRNVVDSGARAGYSQQVIRKLHLMHGGASDQHSGGLFHILG